MTQNRQPIHIITDSAHLEALLAPYQTQIGADFAGYRNHLYRVLTYIQYFRQGDPSQRELIETALVYHDIALWTARQLAYLAPSADLALADNERHGWGLDADLLRTLIEQHHKITAYRGPHAALVNAFRKADWIDATAGVLRKGIPRRHIRAVQKALPAAGFYQTLRRLGPELTHGRFFTMLRQFARVYRW